MRVLLGIVIAAVVMAAGAAGFVYSGVYDIAATDQHTAPVFWLLKTTMRRAVQHQARTIEVPPLDDSALITQGRALFVANCSRCHGAPGVAPEPFALGFRPAPANLANTGIEWKPAQLYWTIKHGMKLTAMPAWEYRLPDHDLWAIVAYVQRLPYESPRAFREALRASAAAPQPSPDRMDAASAANESAKRPAQAPAADAKRGRHVLLQYGCVTCHEIPDVVGAAIPVGPPLDRMGSRRFIAGVLENTPDNMVRWLEDPPAVDPLTAMPKVGVAELEARDIAAYLYKLTAAEQFANTGRLHARRASPPGATCAAPRPRASHIHRRLRGRLRGRSPTRDSRRSPHSHRTDWSNSPTPHRRAVSAQCREQGK